MVKIIKLQNNSEIIGTVVGDRLDSITVDNPFTINYIFSPKNQRPVIGLLRYLPFAEQREISFQKDSILHIVDARSSMSEYYCAVLKSHNTDIDESVDRELNQITEMENAESELHDATDVLSAMLEKLNPNNNLH
jgi:hypothetical protein